MPVRVAFAAEDASCVVYFRYSGKNVHCFFLNKEYDTDVVNVKSGEHFAEVFFVKSRKIVVAAMGTFAAATAALGLLLAQSMYELAHLSLF